MFNLCKLVETDGFISRARLEPDEVLEGETPFGGRNIVKREKY